MANKFLKPVYNRVFEQPFSYRSFDDRLQMQKMVYLLQEEGVNIGHYGFDWYKHGPYSQALLDDMYIEDENRCITVNYTQETQRHIERLKRIFSDPDAKEKYGITKWTECLASIHFLKKKELGSNASEDEILQVLVERKPHLDDDALNRKAYGYIESLITQELEDGDKIHR